MFKGLQKFRLQDSKFYSYVIIYTFGYRLTSDTTQKQQCKSKATSERAGILYIAALHCRLLAGRSEPKVIAIYGSISHTAAHAPTDHAPRRRTAAASQLVHY